MEQFNKYPALRVLHDKRKNYLVVDTDKLNVKNAVNSVCSRQRRHLIAVEDLISN